MQRKFNTRTMYKQLQESGVTFKQVSNAQNNIVWQASIDKEKIDDCKELGQLVWSVYRLIGE